MHNGAAERPLRSRRGPRSTSEADEYSIRSASDSYHSSFRRPEDDVGSGPSTQFTASGQRS